LGLAPEDYDTIRHILDTTLNPEAKFYDSKQGKKVPALDFVDMICWPHFLDLLPSRKRDTLIVDEAQDLNGAQQSLAMKLAHRVIVVGDPFQSCQGFAGSLPDGMRLLEDKLRSTDRDVVNCELSISFRCPQAVAELAREHVPHFRSHPDNPQGIVEDIKRHELASWLEPGDMVVCRTNAPLIGLCYELMSRRKRASILGHEVGTNLLRTIEKVCNKFRLTDRDTSDRFKTSVEQWANAELKEAKEDFDSAKASFVTDVRDCLVGMAERCDTVDQVKTSAMVMFSDQASPISLGTIHKQKGREADNVFILRPDLMPHPMAREKWELEQERNLRYVAVTRTKERLYFTR
jgi:superfamily I DNA/RNA helicase